MGCDPNCHSIRFPCSRLWPLPFNWDWDFPWMMRRTVIMNQLNIYIWRGLHMGFRCGVGFLHNLYLISTPSTTTYSAGKTHHCVYFMRFFLRIPKHFISCVYNKMLFVFSFVGYCYVLVIICNTIPSYIFCLSIQYYVYPQLSRRRRTLYII